MSVFRKPLNSSILSLLRQDDAEEIEEIWKEKFKLIYKHKVIDSKDQSVTQELEKQELKKQSTRFN